LVQPDGTLVVPKKDVTQVAADLYEKGHKDLADELLES
jgi:predicted nucleic-acid-binding protein